MDPQTGPNMPSLWVFLVIVLAVLLAVVMGTSFVMHMIQRRQRHRLQRRIANGEVDLEALGIKRLNVPAEAIEKMPLFTFTSIPDSSGGDGAGGTDPSSAKKETTPHDFFQPTCSICLDDFVYRETQVRELPCKHIFHPDCIDPFLRENSSLCPMCKRSALPAGYCPIVVTNVMVRRERLMRRMREGRSVPAIRRYVPPPAPTPWSRRLDRIRGPNVVAAPPRARVHDQSPSHGVPGVVEDDLPPNIEGDTELGPILSHNSAIDDIQEPPPEIARRGTVARRAWRRERVASLAAREYNEQSEAGRQEDERRPLWRRVLGMS